MTTYQANIRYQRGPYKGARMCQAKPLGPYSYKTPPLDMQFRTAIYFYMSGRAQLVARDPSRGRSLYRTPGGLYFLYRAVLRKDAVPANDSIEIVSISGAQDYFDEMPERAAELETITLTSTQ
jgi:hypothetical protein